ncbi:hypothetical protein B0H16DRAFT_1536797 [Mycena metata]|uniref:F-box domain-containing protein n=1 Tax=Mycena metata TaxID=1033252 RepID=A0AAD7NDI4_9AGAR|nr:hypothetical protein B0H16DRAFT_1536797 [Mycena metata]
MSFTLNHETLPPELWLEIFAHLDERSYTTSYTPFQPLPGVGPEVDAKSAYTTVVLVCRNWHDWGISLLYRNLKIPTSDSSWTHSHPEYGRWVQRAILPSSSTLPDSQTRLPIEMLGLCPNMEVLIRPQLSQSTFEFDPLYLQLPSLKRLEWWDGVNNSLLSVLSAAPNLEYLFLGVEVFQPMNSIPDPTPEIHLPRLRTLRLRFGLSPSSRYLARAISKWSLPALDTLVVDGRMGLDEVWTSLGSRLRVVELGKDTSWPHGCLALRELNYNLRDSSLMRRKGLAYPSATTIGCHVASPLLGDLERSFLPLRSWFPDLQRLRIYGPLAGVLADERFQFPVKLQRVSNRGVYIVEIIDKNGLVVSTYRPES